MEQIAVRYVRDPSAESEPVSRSALKRYLRNLRAYGPQIRGADLRTVMDVFRLSVADLVGLPAVRVENKRTVQKWRSGASGKNMPRSDFKALVWYVAYFRRDTPGAVRLRELLGEDWHTQNWWKLVTVDENGTIHRVPAEV